MDEIALVILLLIVVAAMSLALYIGRPIIDSTIKTSDIKGAQNDLQFIDDYIRTVSREGKDAVRIFKFSSAKEFESIPGEDAIQFSTVSSIQLVDYFTRSFSGNFAYISGNDVQCQEKDGDGDGVTDLVAENNYIKSVFKKAAGALNTSEIIMQITDKTNNVTVFVGNSSIMIDEDPSTSNGAGYTEISWAGTNRPLCQVHAYVNSTVKYDIYYKLYAGADFLTVEVRNIG